MSSKKWYSFSKTPEKELVLKSDFFHPNRVITLDKKRASNAILVGPARGSQNGRCLIIKALEPRVRFDPQYDLQKTSCLWVFMFNSNKTWDELFSHLLVTTHCSFHQKKSHQHVPSPSLTWNLKMMGFQKGISYSRGLIFRFLLVKFWGGYVFLLENHHPSNSSKTYW